MRPFRLGLAGAGRMGRNHLRAMQDSDKVRVVAIAEPADAARTALRSTGVPLHSDLESMLDAGGLDGVLVCVPSTMHLDTVRRLVAAGLPILCEKPVGVTAEQAREAARLAAAASLPLQVGFWRRFVPMLRRLRERIAAGELGDVYLVACYQWDGSPPGEYFRTHSGGIFVDMGVHEFDQTRWLTGQEFGAISALASGVAAEPWPGDPESAQALCDLSGGSSAIVSLGRRFPLGDVCKVEVFGTRDAEECRFLWPPTADDTFFTALRVQAESFAAHAGGRKLEGAGGDDAAAALDAAERAAKLLAAHQAAM
jgi:myo-inositol 2-dehydrogenase/D-chiro-inositol 1-dehydrogenase